MKNNMTMWTEEDEAFWQMEQRHKEKQLVDKMVHVRVHELKCWPYYFQHIVDGLKTFEIRYDDRCYMPGDILHIREYDNEKKEFTNRQAYRKVLYKSDFEQKQGHVVLALGV